jgi:ribosomal protein L3 glutamine methyltransferase
LDEQITLIKSDVYENLKGKKFDLIISNPPYVNAQSIQALPKEYQQEPLLALAAGEDGMDCVRKIIAHAKEHLNENGILIIEIGNERAYAEAAFGHLNLTWLSTSAGDDMVFLLTKEQLEMMAP